MTREQHIELINTLINVKGKVILSGYDNDIYNKLLDIFIIYRTYV